MNKNKGFFKFAALIMCAVMLISSIPMAVYAQDGATVITTKEGLCAVADDPTGTYILGENIEFTQEDFAVDGDFYNDASFFPVIGADAAGFTGSFDGAGYYIKGLKINASQESNVGLFGYNKGTVKNVTLIDSEITASHSTLNFNVGAIVGRQAQGAVLESCVSFNNTVHAAAIGTSAPRVGALAGRVDSSATMKNSFAKSSVTYETETGALSGGLVGYNAGTVSNCYNAAILDKNVKFGLSSYNTGTFSGCYTIDSVKNATNKDSATAVNTAIKSDLLLREKSTYTYFDFDTVWYFNEESGYPYPQLKSNAVVSDDTIGTAYNPYIIENAQDLSKIEDDIYGAYEIEQDIALDDTFKTIEEFYGILRGGEKTITGMSGALVNENHGKIEKLSLEGEIENNASALLANKNYNVISECKTYGAVTNETEASGGIAGYSEGFILDSENHADITAKTRAGGIAGESAATIKNSFNSGTVTGAIAGGITGYTYKSDGLMDDCANTGKIFASEAAGGISGKSNGVVKGSENHGRIYAEGENAVSGGIVGQKYPSGNVTVCVNTAVILAIGKDSIAGGINAINSNELYNCLNTGEIYAQGMAGGLAGVNRAYGEMELDGTSYPRAYGTIRYSVNIAKVESDTTAGTIAGYNEQIVTSAAGHIEYCYYVAYDETPSCSGQIQANYVNYLEPRTWEQLKDPTQFTRLDQTGVWTISSTNGAIAPFLNMGNVEYRALEGVAFESETDFVNLGYSKWLAPVFTPQDATFKTLTWQSDNPDIVSVNGNGRITGEAVGTAVITVTTAQGAKVASITINVQPNWAVFKDGSESAYHSLFGAAWTDARFTIKDNKSLVPIRAAGVVTKCDSIEAVCDKKMLVTNVVAKKDGYSFTFTIGGEDIIVTNLATGEIEDTLKIESEAEYPQIIDGKAYLPARIMSMITGNEIYFLEQSDEMFVIFSESELDQTSQLECIERAKDFV